MKTRDLIIITALASLTVATVLLTAFFYVATIEPIEEKKQIEYQFQEPKDWYLDSTLTEKRHIYYETQSKMK
jgi:hypothetical protein